MIIGATTYAGLFGTLAVIVDEMNEKEIENRTLLTTSKEWARYKGLDKSASVKIIKFYHYIR
jgi:hypothetical protein